MGAPSFDAIEVGFALPAREIALDRMDLVKYAGASGDFNIIHWNDRVATEVGLPGVIAHGMLTMAQAGCVVTSWLGDPGALEEFGVRFTRPVPVPDPGAAALTCSATVAEKLDDRRVRIEITATCGGETVLGRAFAIARLS